MGLKSKQKKWMMIAGGAVVCIALAVAIGSRFREQTKAEERILPEETEQPPIILAGLPHRVDAGLEEVAKPEDVPEEALHDPTRKPDGEMVEGEPVPEEHEEGTRPEEPVMPEGTPQAGDTSGGQIYIPGFGWVENQGGGASGTTAGDMYENGNKIGSMD